MARGDLVHRDAILNVGACGLARVDACQIRRCRTRMIARTVTERVPVALRQAGQHQRVLPELLERFEDARELESGTLARRRPFRHGHAVRHVGEGETQRSATKRRGQPEGRRHGVQHRQRNGRSHSSQKGSAWQVAARDHHGAGLPLRD
jgi:hypothetical protein